MNIRHLAFCACLLAAAPAIADGTPPSDQSIQELLTLTNAHQLLDQVKIQMDSLMASAMRDALQGQTLTPERQAVLDRMKAKMVDLINQTLNWSDLEPMYVRTYRASLSQEELDGMLEFYKSPAGQAYIKKIPVIMQNILVEMQGMIKPMQQKLVEIQKQAIQELKDLKAQGGS